jgi:hypothetical protein
LASSNCVASVKEVIAIMPTNGAKPSMKLK